MTNVVIAKVHSIEVDEAKFSDAVKEFIFAYGLKQLLNDAGSAGKTPDEKLAMGEKKLASLYEGTLRTARVGGGGKDPVAAEMDRIAWEVLRAAIMGQGRKLKDVTDEQKAELIEKYLKKYEAKTRKEAEARLEARKNVPTVDLKGIL